MAKKKKKRIRWLRLVVITAVCVGLVGFGVTQTVSLINRYQYEKTQGERREYIAGLIAQRNDFVATIERVQEPEYMDEEQFNELKEKALYDDVYQLLDQYNYEQVSTEITDDYYEEVLEINSFENEYSRLLERINLIPENYIESLMEDWDRYDFTMAYTQQEDYQSSPAAIEASLDKVPLLIQWDLAWGYIPYGELNIAIAGCAPTSISMVFSYLLQDPTITPSRIAHEAEAAGMYVNGAGSSHEIFPVMAEAYGLNSITLGVDQEAINAALEAGHPVILNMVPGDFTKVGHFIVLTGIENGKYRLNDPNSKKRSATLWDQDVVLSQAANAWTFTK